MPALTTSNRKRPRMAVERDPFMRAAQHGQKSRTASGMPMTKTLADQELSERLSSSARVAAYVRDSCHSLEGVDAGPAMFATFWKPSHSPSLQPRITNSCGRRPRSSSVHDATITGRVLCTELAEVHHGTFPCRPLQSSSSNGSRCCRFCPTSGTPTECYGTHGVQMHLN